MPATRIHKRPTRWLVLGIALAATCWWLLRADSSPAPSAPSAEGGDPSASGMPPPGLRPTDRTPSPETTPLPGSGSTRPRKAPGRATLVVSVHNGERRPRAGVRVVLEAGPTPAQTLTDARGEARLGEIVAGWYQTRLTAPEGRSFVNPAGVELRDDVETRLALVLVEADASIAGRVRTKAGRPVAGVHVRARRHDTEAAAQDLVPVDETGQEAVSDEAGNFRIGGLVPGDYRAHNLPHGLHGSARHFVRAPARGVEIVLPARRELRVAGTVRSEDGRPLAGVDIHPFGQRDRATTSDAQGRFALVMDATETRVDRGIVFRKSSYQTHRHVVTRRVLAAEAEVAIDAVMHASLGVAGVGGRVTDPDGHGLAGQTVYLQSEALDRRYQAITDAFGRYALLAVEVGGPYRLFLRPREGTNGDRELPPFMVRPGGHANIDVVLPALRFGRLRLRLTDSRGAPLGGVRFVLTSDRAVLRPVPLTTDADGHATADSVSAGPVVVASQSAPRYVIRGLEVGADGSTEREIVVDGGAAMLRGEVRDALGQAVAGAAVTLVSTLAQAPVAGSAPVRSETVYTAVSGEGGTFQFAGVGPGPHRLRVVSLGYREVVATHEAGDGSTHVVLVLEAE